MTEKNPRFQEWLEKFNAFYDGSTQKCRLFHTEARRARDEKTKWYRFSTQQIRREIVRGLGELYEVAIAFSRDEALELREREKWGRLAAYIAQTINTIIDSYDELRIEETLDELKQYVKIHIEED